jgi:alkyldihydroxyacetonephosphate synthase
MALARLKVFGWGREGDGMTAEEEAFALGVHRRRFGVSDFDSITVPTLADVRLRAPRIAPPAALAAICSTETYDRAAHGKGFTDAVRAMLNDFASAPDAVAYPANEQDIAAAMDWAGSAGAVLIPFGGGSSVVGGVTPPADGRCAISLDLRRVDKVLEIDRTSRAACIQAGVFGPALEDQLRPHGLTLRHFPQSFEFSTLGGWIATRSGGHFATLYTHIDDFVESLRVVTPAGTLESRRLPGSGAGPSPDRMFIGSEGILGVITEAWMRLQDRPRFAPAAQCGSRTSSRPPAHCGCSVRPGSIRPTAASLMPRRPSTPVPRTVRWRSWCWRSSPPNISWTPGWHVPWNVAPISAVCRIQRDRPTRIAKARRDNGAMPSSACRMDGRR